MLEFLRSARPVKGQTRMAWSDRDPCPCASGRAFGSCCGELCACELAAWRQVLHTEARLMRRIKQFARQTWGLDLLREAIRLFFLAETSDDSKRSVVPAFHCWHAFTWVPDFTDLDGERYPVPDGWPSASLGVTWLVSGAPQVSHVDQTFILTAARSPHSLLLVESVVPGWSLVVRDLLTGRQFHVVEPEISRDVEPDQILFSAVLTLDGISTLMGCASSAVDAVARETAWATRQDHAHGAWLTATQVMDITTSICAAYREACDEQTALDMETYNETPEPHLLRWRVSASFGESFDRLRSLSPWCGTEEAFHDDTGPDDRPRLSLSWYEPPPPPEPAYRRALGYLYLDEGRLAAYVATRTLADRVIHEVQARLGSAATLVESRLCRPTHLPSAVYLKS